MRKLQVFNKKNEQKLFSMPDEVHTEVYEDLGTIFRDANKKSIMTLTKDWSWVWMDKLDRG